MACGILVAFTLDATAALDVSSTPGWPAWWQAAIDPSVREQGTAYLANPDTESVGHLMLAKHYESIGQLPKALFHARQAADSPSATPVTKSLAVYITAFNLGNMGRLEEQKRAIQDYSRIVDSKVASDLFLRSPEIMEFYRLAATGDLGAAKARLDSFGEPKDTDSFISFGLARANLASMQSRDTSLAYEELKKILPPNVRKPTTGIHAANFFYAERLFQAAEAEEALKKCFNGRSQTDYNLPETDLARLCIASANFAKAAEWLEKAQNAKMTLRPNYRQEAIKDLAFAVADFYLATGHPDRALASLEKVEDDFFRPGYTTAPLEYFLTGFHLRKFLACDSQLRLLGAVWLETSLANKAKFLPSLAALTWKRTTALMQFRQNLSIRLGKAPPGVDVAVLYYGPPWLLPAMRQAVGDATFQKICTERAPEGRRLEILAPLLSGGDSKPIHADTPQLLRATILAQRQLPDLVSAYESIPSSLLLALRPLPVAGTNMNFKPAGWMTLVPDGFQIDASDGSVSVSGGGRLLRSTARPEAKDSGALLEKLSKALLAADFAVTEQTAKKIEGRAVAFAEPPKK